MPPHRHRRLHGAGGLASLPPAHPLLLIYIALLRVLLTVLTAGLHSGRSSDPRIPGRTKKTTARLAERMSVLIGLVFHDETASG